MSSNLIKASMAEVIGTFTLVFFGCATIVINDNFNNVFGLMGVALAFGLIVLAVVYALGHISGAHINPAVTIGLACTGKFSWSRVPFYVVAQLLGAALGALLLKCTLANGDALGMTLPTVSLGKAFLIEVLLTAFLMFVVMGTATDPRASSQFAAIAVGSVIIVDVLVGGVITGASMNPARSFGPALVEMHFEHIWLYFAAPIVGAIVGAFLYVACASVKN